MKQEKWKETFSDAMDELADEYVEEAGREQKTAALKPAKNRRIFIGIAAGLAAAAAVVFGVLAGTGALRKDPEVVVSAEPGTKTDAENETKPQWEGVEAMKNCALVTAEYPERVVPSMRRELAANYRGKLHAFLKESVKTLLTEEGEENPVASPANMYLAFALLAEASEGETREEVLRALGIGSMEELRQITNDYWNANYNESPFETERFASSVWLNQGLPYLEDKLVTFRDQYYASAFQGPMGDPSYDAALRDWINDETGNLLSDGIKNISMDPRGVMDLVTTVYYKAVWGTLFNPEQTEEGEFHGIDGDSTVSYLRSDGWMSAYYAGEHFGAISLTCGDHGEMVFFLPDEDTDARSLASDEEALSIMLDTAQEREEKWSEKERVAYPLIHLWIPKFDISSERDLAGAMQRMGIEKAFSEKDADFSGILDTDDPVFLSKVQNNIRIAIDENGVTAASMIDMALEGAAIPQEEVDFKLDRPFMFALRSGMGDLLFVGIVEQF